MNELELKQTVEPVMIGHKEYSDIDATSNNDTPLDESLNLESMEAEPASASPHKTQF